MSMRRLVRLVIDFDGTLTTKDTLHLVARAGYSRQQQDTPAKPLKPWQEIVDAYTVDYTQRKARYEPAKHMRTTVEAELKWLNSLKSVEEASAQRVYEAGVFDNVTATNLQNAATDALKAGEIELRSGWADLLNEVYTLSQHIATDRSKHQVLQIISVNWSRMFIWSVLKTASEGLQGPRCPPLDAIAVYANEMPPIADGPLDSTGNVKGAGRAVKNLRVSKDKLEVMSIDMPSNGVDGQNCITIYIGDSTTDLQCLLSADVAVCVRDDPMSHSQSDLLETLDRLKIPSKHIGECKLADIETEEAKIHIPPCVWWCEDFHAVVSWLKGALQNEA